MQAMLEAHPNRVECILDRYRACIQLDKREAIFDGLREVGFGGWIPFIHLFYAEPSDLLYTGVAQPQTLLSQRGSRQDDPLRPFIFCVAFHPAFRATATSVGDDGYAGSYKDDAPLLGTPAALDHAFPVMIAEAA